MATRTFFAVTMKMESESIRIAQFVIAAIPKAGAARLPLTASIASHVTHGDVLVQAVLTSAARGA